MTIKVIGIDLAKMSVALWCFVSGLDATNWPRLWSIFQPALLAWGLR